MRRLLLTLTLALTVIVAGCAEVNRPGPVSDTQSITAQPDGAPTEAAAILGVVLRRYVTTPDENSFGDSFENVYVIDHTAEPAQAIGPAEQAYLTDSLADLAPVRFVADRDEVIEYPNGDTVCGVVPDGILMTLGTPQGSGDQREVDVEGYVACLGATWLTYVVVHGAAGWRVAGTTGSIAVA